MTSTFRFVGIILILIALAALIGLLSIWFGPASADPSYAVFQVRLPRYVLAIVLGAALGLAGLAVQLATKNPLSDPELLGINQSAVFAVCLASLIGGKMLGAYTLFAAALLGGSLGGMAVLLLASSAGITRDRLILGGLTLAFFFGSIGHGILLLRDSDLFELLHWMAGKLSGADWFDVKVGLAFLLSAVLACAFRVSKWNLLEMGDDSVRSLGVNPARMRIELIGLTVFLTSATVALAGPIGFVGLIVPHLARMLVGFDYRKVLPLVLLLGACLVSASDLLARIFFYPVEIPVGVVTALIGGPYFLYRARRA